MPRDGTREPLPYCPASDRPGADAAVALRPGLRQILSVYRKLDPAERRRLLILAESLAANRPRSARTR